MSAIRPQNDRLNESRAVVRNVHAPANSQSINHQRAIIIHAQDTDLLDTLFNFNEGNEMNDTPQPGHYKTRVVRNGPFVPARVWINVPERDEAGDLMDDEGLMMEVDGEFVNGQHMDQKWLWMIGNPITKQEYDFMIADSDHAQKYRPGDPKSQPTKPIDLSTQPPIF